MFCASSKAKKTRRKNPTAVVPDFEPTFGHQFAARSHQSPPSILTTAADEAARSSRHHRHCRSSSADHPHNQQGTYSANCAANRNNSSTSASAHRYSNRKPEASGCTNTILLLRRECVMFHELEVMRSRMSPSACGLLDSGGLRGIFQHRASPTQRLPTLKSDCLSLASSISMRRSIIHPRSRYFSRASSRFVPSDPQARDRRCWNVAYG